MQIPAIYCDGCGAAIFSGEEYFELDVPYLCPTHGRIKIRMKYCIDCMEEARTEAYIDIPEPDECSIAKAYDEERMLEERKMFDGKL